MPVTTRLALKRASSGKAKKIKKHASKKKTPHVDNMVPRTKTENLSPAAKPPGFLQWITLRDPPSGVISNGNEFFSILQEIQKLRECVCVARGRPEELAETEWLLIEWRSHADMERFLISELSLRFNEALSSSGCLISREVAPLLEAARFHIIQNHPVSPRNHMHEVLTLYFPEDLHPKNISSIEKFKGLRSLGVEPEFLHENPLAGLVTNFPVIWKEGTCEYQGITARRLVWLNTFLHKEGERIFKEIRYPPRKSQKPRDVMADFFWELESLGMLGYESLHTSFLEVDHLIGEDYRFKNPVSTWSDLDTPSLPPSMCTLPPEVFDDDSEL